MVLAQVQVLVLIVVEIVVTCKTLSSRNFRSASKSQVPCEKQKTYASIQCDYII